MFLTIVIACGIVSFFYIYLLDKAIRGESVETYQQKQLLDIDTKLLREKENLESYRRSIERNARITESLMKKN